MISISTVSIIWAQTFHLYDDASNYDDEIAHLVCMLNFTVPRQLWTLCRHSSWSRSTCLKLNNVDDMNGGDMAIRWMSVYLIKLWISHLIDGPRASGGANRHKKIHEIILNRWQSFKWANHFVVWFAPCSNSLPCRAVHSVSIIQVFLH